MSARNGVPAAWGMAATLALGGCGGGPATLHPAHTLDVTEVALGAGVTGNFAVGDIDTKMDLGRSVSAGATAPDAEQIFADGAVVSALVSPGVSPWFGGRVGLGSNTEADLTYAGRGVRGGARHAFETENWALSLGAGATAFLLHPGSQTPSGPATAGYFLGSTEDANTTGWGLDAPIVAGYRSAGQVLQAWIGSRVGFELAQGELPITPLDGIGIAEVDGTRWYVGGMLGLAVGVSPIWVGVQVDVAYQGITGTIETPSAADPLEFDVDADGMTVNPAGVLWGKF